MLQFGGLLLYETQRVIKEAEELPAASPHTYDPIAASQTIFFKMVQMFIMMTFIQQLPALSSGLTKKMD